MKSSEQLQSFSFEGTTELYTAHQVTINLIASLITAHLFLPNVT
jgi:hypothetical protein